MVKAAFNAICKESKSPESWTVALYCNRQFYGGPEEGGWYGNDRLVEAYQVYDTEEKAKEAYDAVQKLAEELTAQSKTEHGQHCLNQMDWLEVRGLDADFLPENDGPDSHYVEMMQGYPEHKYGRRGYD